MILYIAIVACSFLAPLQASSALPVQAQAGELSQLDTEFNNQLRKLTHWYDTAASTNFNRIHRGLITSYDRAEVEGTCSQLRDAQRHQDARRLTEAFGRVELQLDALNKLSVADSLRGSNVGEALARYKWVAANSRDLAMQAEAKSKIAQIFYFGLGVEKDVQEALQIMEKLSNQTDNLDARAIASVLKAMDRLKGCEQSTAGNAAGYEKLLSIKKLLTIAQSRRENPTNELARAYANWAIAQSYRDSIPVIADQKEAEQCIDEAVNQNVHRPIQIMALEEKAWQWHKLISIATNEQETSHYLDQYKQCNETLYKLASSKYECFDKAHYVERVAKMRAAAAYHVAKYYCSRPTVCPDWKRALPYFQLAAMQGDDSNIAFKANLDLVSCDQLAPALYDGCLERLQRIYHTVWQDEALRSAGIKPLSDKIESNERIGFDVQSLRQLYTKIVASAQSDAAKESAKRLCLRPVAD